MATPDFWIKQGDTSPILEATLEDENGSAVDLTGANVDFHMKRAGGSSVVVDAAANIVDAANGVVQYAWASGDTDESGSYVAEFEVTYSDGSVESFPNHTHLQIKIDPEVA